MVEASYLLRPQHDEVSHGLVIEASVEVSQSLFHNIAFVLLNAQQNFAFHKLQVSQLP